ncbi:MAG TPA: tripartite tricarboxylate transporter TctB family protein [Burkholderiales bacterium]|nr:tripartite tricarboxylate transporter TctB family protein [Burkholderiales bacterium]
MHKNASLALSLLIMIVSGYGVVAATAWPWKAALFPLVIGVPLFALAAAEALWTLFGAEPASEEARDFQLSIGTDTVHRTLVAAGWIFAFFAAIVLIGFPIAVPLFVFLYLKLQGREGWGISIAITLGTWAVFYGLFDLLLHLPFPAGWLLSWSGFSS